MTAEERWADLTWEEQAAEIAAWATHNLLLPLTCAEALKQEISKALCAAVARERQACLEIAAVSRPHAGRPCRCGKCVGALAAADSIQQRLEQ